MVDITLNKLSARILNCLRHVSLASENFTAKIFSFSLSVFRCKANSYFMDFIKLAKWTIYITSSALLFSVSHKTNLARTDGITVIAIPRDFKHMVYFLVKFFRRSVISFFRWNIFLRDRLIWTETTTKHFVWNRTKTAKLKWH